MDQGAAHVSNLQQQDLEDRDDQKEEVEPIGHGALDEGDEAGVREELFLRARPTFVTDPAQLGKPRTTSDEIDSIKSKRKSRNRSTYLSRRRRPRTQTPLTCSIRVSSTLLRVTAAADGQLGFDGERQPPKPERKDGERYGEDNAKEAAGDRFLQAVLRHVQRGGECHRARGIARFVPAVERATTEAISERIDISQRCGAGQGSVL